MLITIDLQSEIPLYLQLKTQLIKGIATGELAEGEPLPSFRQLSADLGINMLTVKKTYDQLKQEGYLTMHRQKGAVVNGQLHARMTDQYVLTLKQQLAPFITEAFCYGMKKAQFTAICNALYEELEEGKEND
ncbi:MAG: GntR family transcriptional regulator [Hyphomonadaceae bacterium]|nr:GntR family transcriptional regulator [Clostridia bacterium]